MNHPNTVAALARSIREIGQIYPIITDSDGHLVDGQGRLDACLKEGIKPWVEVRSALTREARYHTMIRRPLGPLEAAEIANLIRAEITPAGARRAPGTGKTQDAVAAAMAERFGMRISPREVSYALALGQAEPAEQEALRAEGPTSMRAAHRALQNHRLGVAVETVTSATVERTELVKTAYEFKAAVLRRSGTLTDADRALLADLRAAIDRTLAEDDHAPA